MVPSYVSRTARSLRRVPLHVRMLGAIALGVAVGLIGRGRVADWDQPAKYLIGFIRALAMPLIFAAIVRALMATQVHGTKVRQLAWLLTLNTSVAVAIALVLDYLIDPGRPLGLAVGSAATLPTRSLTDLLRDAIPSSVLGPFADSGSSKTLSAILLAIAFGMALRRMHSHPAFVGAMALVSLVLETFIVLLGWAVELLPVCVLGLIAAKVGSSQSSQFQQLIWFVLTVCGGLALQSIWYLARIRLGSWARPREVLTACRDALLTAFSTGSSVATMPVTYERLTRRLGVREESANLGALVGTNFNNDGTALYEAVAALFVAQLSGHPLAPQDKLVVVVVSMLAAIGAAGVPEGGAATLTLVLTSVGLSPEYVPFLLTVDWLLDRCRTTVNVLGDINVSCLLDGKQRASSASTDAPAVPYISDTGTAPP